MGVRGRGADAGPFIKHIRPTFGTTDVVVVHNRGQEDEQRYELEAHVQGSKAFFDVDAPVFDDDEIEIPDPRGGIRTVYVTNAKVNQASGSMSSYMSHIAASFTSTRPRPPQPVAAQIIHGDAVIVSGSHVNVALGNGQINQQLPVTEGYESLARAVGQALKMIETSTELDADDRESAEEAGTTVLAEIVKPEPDRTALKRALALLRGILPAAASGAAGAAAKGLIQQLFL